MQPLLFSNRNTLIKSVSKQLGFDFCGITKAIKLDDDARRLESWLNQGRNGEMDYMSQILIYGLTLPYWCLVPNR